MWSFHMWYNLVRALSVAMRGLVESDVSARRNPVTTPIHLAETILAKKRLQVLFCFVFLFFRTIKLQVLFS